MHGDNLLLCTLHPVFLSVHLRSACITIMTLEGPAISGVAGLAEERGLADFGEVGATRISPPPSSAQRQCSCIIPDNTPA